MSRADERLRDIEAAEQVPAEKRLQRLRTRAKKLENNEAYWSVGDVVESLLNAAEGLLELAKESADAAESLDGILEAIALILDGLG